MTPTTHQERKDLRKRHEAARHRATAQVRPTRRQNHTKALEQILIANTQGVAIADLLVMGRRAGLRPRHIRRAIAGKAAHAQVAHPFTRKQNRRTQRLGPSMTTIMTLVSAAITENRPLTEEEVRELRLARKKVCIPSVNLTHPKLFRDPDVADRMKRRAEMRRTVRRAKCRMVAPPDQLHVNLKPVIDFEAAELRAFAAVLAHAENDPADVTPEDITEIMDTLAAEKISDLPKPPTGNTWHLTLECGHVTTRPVKRRGAQGEDPAPKWVYCGTCEMAEGASLGPKRKVVEARRGD